MHAAEIAALFSVCALAPWQPWLAPAGYPANAARIRRCCGTGARRGDFLRTVAGAALKKRGRTVEGLWDDGNTVDDFDPALVACHGVAARASALRMVESDRTRDGDAAPCVEEGVARWDTIRRFRAARASGESMRDP
ncbi:hypothetical protein [Polyangium jinanense]|uniref:Uncharacterized protein n=1 Tax=Polyangium jinanense TaxID=2829994 RepID=A0A9X4ASV7_9BACT|nr:hypothetical protein [Polyangium jinanense]MDC3982896.1 hypothetical protein [Polyangium jinanense]